MQANDYIGRYAPSPSGDLHLGNLRTALLAWLHARLQGGQFLLRMEDLDTPRVVAGSAERILSDLEWLGIDWDGEVIYQSDRTDLYQQALEELSKLRLVYPCFCSRKDIRLAPSAPHSNTGVYPGTCSQLTQPQIEHKSATKTPALRMRVGAADISYTDACLGPIRELLAHSCGDFVVRRADGLFAYQLAVVVDDMQQGISDVLRGADLASSTSRQLYLAQTLEPNRPSINYVHVPLMLDSDGRRMAKRDGSQSAEQWREEGNSAAQMLQMFARQLGFDEPCQLGSATDLLHATDLSGLMNRLCPATNHASSPE